MSVSVYKERKALVLQWDAGDEYDGAVTIETTNSADLSDVSSTELVSNPGFAAVSFPLEYVGSMQVRVLANIGGFVIDEGEVDVS